MKNVKPTTLIGLALIPLLVLSGLIGTGLGSNATIKMAQAAVVNNDEAVTIDGQIIPLGRQLTAELVKTDREQNFTWVIASPEKARTGLLNGSYAAVVTIPKEFSATATKLKDPKEASQATIEVATSQVTGIADAAIGQTVAQAAVRAFNSMLTEKYLDQIYLGFNKMGDQFVTLKDGTLQLADGAGQLANGLTEAAPGADKLADGLGQLAAGSEQLRSGAGQLGNGMLTMAGGANQLAANSQQLRDGVTKAGAGMAELGNNLPKLAAGSQQLAVGAGQLNTGITSYAGGVMQLASQAPALNTGVGQYVAGVEQYVAGVEQFTTGTSQYVAGVDQLLTGLAPFFAGLPGLADGLTQLSQGMEAFATGATNWSNGVDQLATSANQLSAGVATAKTGVQQVADGLQNLKPGAEQVATGAESLKTGLQQFNQQMGSLSIPCPAEISAVGQCDAFTAGVTAAATAAKNGSQPLVQAAGQVATGATQVSGGVTGLASGAAAAAGGLDSVATGMTAWTNGVDAAKTGATGLASAAGNLKTGFDNLHSQLTPLAAQAPTISTNITKLKNGGQDLVNSIPAITNGGASLKHGGSHPCVGTDCGLVQAVAMFTGGLGQIDGAAHQNSLGLIDGAKKTAEGAGTLNGYLQQLAAQFGSSGSDFSQLVDGVTKYTHGVDELAAGLGQAAGKAPELVAGINKYTGGVDQAASGAKTLAGGVSKLAGGATSLADGTQKLADGVASGAKEIPSYSASERESLAKVVAAPVATGGFESVFLPNAAWITLVAALALWLAALATYVMVPTIRRSSALSTASSVAVLGEALLPGVLIAAVGALAGALAVGWFLALGGAKVLAIFGMLFLGGLTFTAVNQALVANLGGAGRVISAAFAAVTFGAAMTFNPTMTSLAAFSPLTPAVSGLRSLIVGGASTTVSALALIGWLVVGLLLGLFAVTRSRTIKAAALG